MKDIEIRISKDTRMVELDHTTIGNDGENLQSKLVFTFEDDAFVDGQARLEYYANGEKFWTLAEKKENRYEVPVLSVMTTEGRIDMQLVITEGTNENEIPIFKSNMFYVYCNSSINAEIEQPEEYPEWIDRANTKLNEADNLNVEMNDGVITITKKDGTTYSENVRGPQGPQGVSGKDGRDGAVKLIPVTEFPTEGIETDAIYIKPSENPNEQNIYDEYVYVNGNWEKISGGATVNLDGYATEEYVDNKVNPIEEKTQYLEYDDHCVIFQYNSNVISLPVQTGYISRNINPTKAINLCYKTGKPVILFDCSYMHIAQLEFKDIKSTTSSIYKGGFFIDNMGTRFVNYRMLSLTYNAETDLFDELTKMDFNPNGFQGFTTKDYVDGKVSNINTQIGNINNVLATLTEVSE